MKHGRPFRTLAFFCCAWPCLHGWGGNLISNPGFEDGEPPWVQNNWLKNDAEFEIDRENPHTGKASYKLNFLRATGGPNVQFYYPDLPVKPNQAVKISFWARGVSNGAALHVNVRKGVSPYKVYFRAESGLTDRWQEYVYTFHLPGDLDPKDVQLTFGLRQEGVVWMDDVSVTEMPPVDPGPAPAHNLVRNPSFEVGTDGWTAAFRLREFKTLWEESGSDYPAPEGARLDVIDAGDSPHGGKYLSLNIEPGSRAVLTSAYLPARYGHPLLLQFSLRSDAKREFLAGVGSGKNGNFHLDGSATLASGPEWRKFSVPMTLKPGLDGVYCIEFRFDEPGRFDIDAVSLIEKESPGVALFPPSFAIVSGSGAPAGHLYDRGAPAQFRLVLADAAEVKTQACEIGVFDYLGREAARTTVELAPDSRGAAEALFSVPTGQYGTFRMEARPAGNEARSALPLAEQIYSVVPPLPPPGERPDSFFGGHVDLTTYNLEIARKAGFRWLRTYPPLSTLWMSVEQTPGEWRFYTDGVARAKSQGFQILGIFGTCPDFAADLDPKAVAIEKPRWKRSFVPADLGRWKEYVTRTFGAFHPYIDAWELWNEPDGDYMRFRPGLERSSVYLSLLQATREALDATGKPAFLLGPACSNINAGLSWKLLDKGAGRFLDAFSFHYYDLAAGGDNPDAAYLTPILKKYGAFSNRTGAPMPLWHTEGGIYLYGSRRWLQTYRVPPSSTVAPAAAAAAMVRTALFFKASGVKRYFDFYVGASRAGGRVHEDITSGFIEVTGIPSPGIASHAAMVALVEDVPGAGVETREVDGHTVNIAHFAGTKGRVDAYWSNGPVRLAPLIGEDQPRDVRDMMGNAISPAEVTLDEYPVYVLEPLSVD